jgi:hypothetical protein
MQLMIENGELLYLVDFLLKKNKSPIMIELLLCFFKKYLFSVHCYFNGSQMDGKSVGTEFTLRGLWSSDFVRP